MKPYQAAVRRSRPHAASRQRGVVLLFAMIALVVMMIAAVAMVRSFQGSLFMAGNIGFKRDMRNQGELAVSKALDYFRTGVLNTAGGRANAVKTANYSAQILPTDAQGIPAALALIDADFKKDYSAPDLLSQDVNNSIQVRYVIDRLCAVPGDETTLGTDSCLLANNPTPPSSGALNIKSSDRSGLTPTSKAASPQSVIYRLSVRVTGPRNTVSFFQSTFTVPS